MKTNCPCRLSVDVLWEFTDMDYMTSYEVGSAVIGLGKAAMAAGKTTSKVTFIKPGAVYSESRAAGSRTECRRCSNCRLLIRMVQQGACQLPAVAPTRQAPPLADHPGSSLRRAMTVFPAVAVTPASETKDVAYALAAGPKYMVTIGFFPTSNLAKAPGTAKLRWVAINSTSKLQSGLDINTQTRMKQPSGGQLLDTQDGRTTQVMQIGGKLYSGGCLRHHRALNPGPPGSLLSSACSGALRACGCCACSVKR
jgi:hypothetical protein